MELAISAFEPIRQRFSEVMDEKTFLKEASFAVQLLSKNSYLASSTQKSVLESVLNVAQIGITLNPALKLAYLVPRRVGSDCVCCLEPSYQGLCKLTTDTGSVKNIYAEIVYSNDKFDRILGTENRIVHIPKNSDRGEAIGVYAVAHLFDGRTQTEYMEKLNVYEIRDYSESYKSFVAGKTKDCIWNRNEFEMWRKTVIKRLCKYLPKTENWERLEKAIEMDNQDFKIDYWQIDKIEQLLKTSSMAEEKKEYIWRYLNTYTKEEAHKIIHELEESQVNRIHAGLNYNQGDIIEHNKQTIG